MMMGLKKYGLVLLLGSMLLSCGKEEEKPVTATPATPTAKTKADPGFRKFVRQFEYKMLPLAFYPCKVNSEFLPRIESGDKYGEEASPSFAHSTFKTNGEYVALITTVDAKCDVPVISTYDRQGNLIDKKQMSACSTNCGLTCNGYVNIDNNYNIYVCDSVTEQTCDGSRVLPNPRKEYVRYRKGRLMPDGKIELSEAQEKDL